MALINCPECGKEMSDSAAACPNCGCPNPNNKTTNKIIIPVLIAIIVVLVIAIIVVLLPNKKNKTVRIQDTETAESVTEKAESDSMAALESEVNELETGFSEDKVERTTITKDQVVTVENKCEFAVKGYTINSIIEPPHASGYYSYYEADAGNVYVDIKMDIKNLNNVAVDQDEILDSVKCIYDNNYEYNCFFVTEEDNGSNFQYTSIYDIKPLTSLSYHMLASVPEEIKNNSKPLYVLISVDGKEYKCVLR